jgi:hypothetical protein
MSKDRSKGNQEKLDMYRFKLGNPALIPNKLRRRRETAQLSRSLHLVTIQNPMGLWCRLFKLTLYITKM